MNVRMIVVDDHSHDYPLNYKQNFNIQYTSKLFYTTT